MAIAIKEEDARTEFKENLDEEGILKTIVAFANTAGGTIFIGIKDNGTISGVTPGKGKLEGFISKTTNEIKPAIYPQIEKIEQEGKLIIRIGVSESVQKPHLYKGVAYKRIDKTTIAITNPQELLAIVQTRFFADREIVAGATLEDLDTETINRFIQKGISAGRLPSETTTESLFKNMNLVKGGTPTTAAIILFGKNPGKFFPQHGIKCAVMRGTSIIDIANYEGNFFRCLDDALVFATKSVRRRIEIRGLIREEILLPPVDALRECLVNSLVHRDYSVMSSGYLGISETGVEVKNPGTLSGLSISDLKKPHQSFARNPLLANCAYLGGYIEKWGLGTLKLVESARSVGIESEFSEKQGFFRVLFPYRGNALNPRQEKLRNLIMHGKSLKLKAGRLAKSSGVSLATAKRDLDTMVEMGFLEKSGRGPSAAYRNKLA